MPKELIDWWHNGGGKKQNGGENFGYEEGQITPEDLLEQWEDLGRPSGSKPNEQYDDHEEDYYGEEE